MERLHGPPLPYARAMLGARTVHEWAHLAVEAGWVPRTVSRDEYRGAACGRWPRSSSDHRCGAGGGARADGARPRRARRSGRRSRRRARAAPSTRMPDYQANLVARAS